MEINSYELYLNAILLLVNEPTDVNKALVAKLLKLVETQKSGREGLENETTRIFVTMTSEVLKQNLSKDGMDNLCIYLLRYKEAPKFVADPDMYKLLYNGLTSEERLSPSRCIELRMQINNAITAELLNDQTRQLFGKIQRGQMMSDPIEQEAFFGGLKDHLEVFKTTLESNSSLAFMDTKNFPGLVQNIDMTNKDDVRDAVRKNNQLVTKGGMKTGLQGLNRMFGPSGGFVRGESIVINALSHNYKTGLLLSFARWTAQYNPVPPTQNGRKPLIWLCSLENEAWRDTIEIFRNMWETEHMAKSDSLTEDQIVEYVTIKFSELGWSFHIDRFEPDTFGYEEYILRYETFVACGYEVVVSIIDYMNKMKRPNDARRDDQLIGLLYSRIRNYTTSRDTTLITAHQLNRKAEQVIAEKYKDVVKFFTPMHLGDSIDVQREIDMSIYCHIEKGSDGWSYLTMNWGKHRNVHDTPDRDKYTAYRFTPYGIIDDIMGKDASTRDIHMTAPDMVTDDIIGADDVY